MPTDTQRFHLDVGTESLGCRGCALKQGCGGLRRSEPAWNCRDFCCGAPLECSLVCEDNPGFALDLLEIRGFSSSDVTTRFPQVNSRPPVYVPVVQHRYLGQLGHRGPEWAAIPMREVFKLKDGRLTPVASSAVDLRAYFGLGSRAKVIVVGVAKDEHLERYWEGAERDSCAEALGELGVELAVTRTSPCSSTSLGLSTCSTGREFSWRPRSGLQLVSLLCLSFRAFVPRTGGTGRGSCLSTLRST